MKDYWYINGLGDVIRAVHKTGLSKRMSLNDCEEFFSDMELLFGGINE